jgi:hypothetical protein
MPARVSSRLCRCGRRSGIRCRRACLMLVVGRRSTRLDVVDSCPVPYSHVTKTKMRRVRRSPSALCFNADCSEGSRSLWAGMNTARRTEVRSCGRECGHGRYFWVGPGYDVDMAAVQLPAKPPGLHPVCEKTDDRTGPRTDGVPRWMAKCVWTTLICIHGILIK